MVKSLQSFDKQKRRSAKSGPSSFALSAKKQISKPRTTYRYLSIWPGHQLKFSIRRFRTQPKNQSKKFRQLVLYFDHLGFIPFQEIAIRHKKVYSKRNNATIRQRRPLLIRSLPYMLMSLGLIGLVFFGIQIIRPQNITVAASGTIPTPQASLPISPKTIPRSHPRQLRIEKINLDVPIIDVGQKADGSMETPNVLDYVVGWYKFSPTPGELGPSIIVGHVDSYKGISVFWRLRELAPGDMIAITRDDGSIANFKVDSLRQFDQANFPSQEVYGNINYAGLRLITCGGTFNRKTGHYDENTVVFATLQE